MLGIVTGLVFEAVVPGLGAASPVAGGGRYDQLLSAVGAAVPIPAVGSAIHTERLLQTLQCPKQLGVYQDSRHSVGNVPAANLGPTPAQLVADWMQARLAGKPMANEKWFVDGTGRVTKTPIG